MELSGKIDNDGFKQLIGLRCGAPRAEVHTGPAFGVDVSVINLSPALDMAVTSDPLSHIPSLGLQESAWLSVHLMANDMATTGFAPMYSQMVLNLPTTLSSDELTAYWGYIHQYCKAIGVAITGGHTGSIEGQNSTIAGGGTMMLTAPAGQIKLSKYAREGDAIIVTKCCALSSAAILAMSFPQTVKNKLGKEVYDAGCASFYETSSLADGLAAVKVPNEAITAMHDVTEGGVLGAICEMAIASGNGVVVHNEALPLGEVQTRICGLFDLDPRYCIGAGAMVIAAKPGQVEAVITHLAQQNISAAIVGHFTPKAQGLRLVQNGHSTPISYGQQDPYWAAFFTALKKGWK